MVALYNRRQGASEQGNERLKNDVSIGALPCRGAYGLEASRVYGYLCALLHNMFEWYKPDCLPHEDQPLRLRTIVYRDMLLAARVTRHAHTLTLHLADYAADAARRLQQQFAAHPPRTHAHQHPTSSARLRATDLPPRRCGDMQTAGRAARIAHTVHRGIRLAAGRLEQRSGLPTRGQNTHNRRADASCAHFFAQKGTRPRRTPPRAPSWSPDLGCSRR